jgi:predicted ArsR family transcriptional regulator
VARAAGVRIGEEDGSPSGPDYATATVVEVLGKNGYEPRLISNDVCLTNCPFDRLALRHTELVCGMNLALIEGVIDALHLDSTKARLEPEPGFCCVKIATPPGS